MLMGVTPPIRNRGLCQIHYSRLRSRGTTNYVGKANEGASRHPLYVTWKNAKRKGCVDEWLVFANFVRDVRERPHFMAHFLQPNKSQPLGPTNWAWSSKRPKKGGRWTKASNKLWHARNGRKLHNAMLKMRFGITVEDYTAILAAQGGVCKICGKTQNKRLAVDHCHVTGIIRGLLCANCNTGLGLFLDDPELLDKAIGYLNEERKAALFVHPSKLRGAPANDADLTAA